MKTAILLISGLVLASCATTDTASPSNEQGASADTSDYPMWDPGAERQKAGVYRTTRGEFIKCTKEKPLGSFVSEVTCRTVADEEEAQKRASGAMDEIRNQSGMEAPVGGGF